MLLFRRLFVHSSGTHVLDKSALYVGARGGGEVFHREVFSRKGVGRGRGRPQASPPHSTPLPPLRVTTSRSPQKTSPWGRGCQGLRRRNALRHRKSCSASIVA